MNQDESVSITIRHFGNIVNQYKIDLDDESLSQHDKKAFAKCCESLTFLIRDMAYITLQNFESCIHCLRTFVEACVQGGNLLI
jgi:brefeldin A-resistance guanine nucleotide exchange factor 1